MTVTEIEHNEGEEMAWSEWMCDICGSIYSCQENAETCGCSLPYIDHECTDEVVCPWCGYEHQDSWELSADDAEWECDECGKPFNYSRYVSVTYSTSKVEDSGKV